LANEIGEEAAAEIRIVFIGKTDARLASSDISRSKPIARKSPARRILKSAAGTFGYRRLAGRRGGSRRTLLG
jgi:hypothetical protein